MTPSVNAIPYPNFGPPDRRTSDSRRFLLFSYGLKYPRRQELVDLLGKVLHVRLERKMPRVHKVQHQVLHVALERLSASPDEDGVVRAPEREHGHAARAEILLPARVQSRVRAIVVEQRKLRLLLSRAREQRRVERVRLWRDAREQRRWHAVRVLPRGRAELQEREERLCVGRACGERRRGPVLLERRPEVLAEPLHVRVPVLRDDRGHALGVPHGDAERRGGLCVNECKANYLFIVSVVQRKRSAHAVVEDVDRELFHLECVEEGLDGQRKVIERILVLSLRWHFGEAEAG